MRKTNKRNLINELEHLEKLKEHVDPKHDQLKINVYYTKGGRSMMTGDAIARGLYLHLTPCSAVFYDDGKFRIGSYSLMGSKDVSGYKIFIKPLSRKSKKQAFIIFEKLKPIFKEITNMFAEKRHQDVFQLVRKTANTDPNELVKAKVEAEAKPDETKGMEFITKGVQAVLDKQGDTSELMPKDIKVAAKFFNPMGAGVWFLYDIDRNNPDILWVFAMLSDPVFAECGTMSLRELQSIRPRIERDIHFPMGKHTLQHVIDMIKASKHI